MALLVNARTAAAAPGKQVSRTGEGSPREEEDRAGNGVSQLGEEKILSHKRFLGFMQSNSVLY